MTNTTYYNLNIAEGTDIVNPLTVDNPNYEKIDEVMHDNAVAGVTLATELTNATIHALTRENSDCSVIRFIATSRWKAGDSVTVDGVPVLALLPSGETLPDGAYVINANVLCVLTGTNLTVYVGKSATDANEIAYNDTNVEAALNALNNSLANVNTDLSEVNSTVSTLTTGLEEVNSDLASIKDYSTDEQLIGTFLGKPLYKKSYKGEAISASTGNVLIDRTLTTDYIDDVVDMYGSFSEANSNIIWNLPYFTSESWRCMLRVDSEGLSLHHAGIGINFYNLTIVYTKK